MRGSITGARALTTATCLVAICLVAICLVATIAGCERTWVLPGPAGGSSGSQAGASGVSSGGVGGGAGQSGNGGLGMGGGIPFPFGSGGAAGSGGRTGSMCGGTIRTADLMFVVDRDPSMSEAFGDTTRMNAVHTAIEDVVGPNQKAVNFGYQDFPSLGPCTGGNMCCLSNDSRAVFPVPSNLGAIEGALACGQSQGPGQPQDFSCVATVASRPVSQVLGKTPGILNPTADLAPNDSYVILLIDGSPGCIGEDPNMACYNAKSAVARLSQLLVKTFVVALGTDAANDTCLGEMALLGGTTATLMGVTDPKMLADRLDSIVAMAASAACTIRLNRAQDHDQVSIYVNGTEILYDPTMKNGWAFSPPGSNARIIQVYGKACETLQAAQRKDVEINTTGCPS